jgi:hypothetical protein
MTASTKIMISKTGGGESDRWCVWGKLEDGM